MEGVRNYLKGPPAFGWLRIPGTWLAVGLFSVVSIRFRMILAHTALREAAYRAVLQPSLEYSNWQYQ